VAQVVAVDDEEYEFQRCESRVAICNAIEQASSGTVKWLRKTLTDAEACKRCV